MYLRGLKAPILPEHVFPETRNRQRHIILINELQCHPELIAGTMNRQMQNDE